MNKEKRLIVETRDPSINKHDFVEFGNINCDCPSRDYGNYKWDNQKREWIKNKL